MKSLLTILFALTALNSTAFADAHRGANSLYNLETTLTNQTGETHGLDVYEGKPVLITLFYGSCPMACPLLIDTVRAVERAASVEQRADLRVLLISIDPENDTPAALLKLAQERRIDLSRWTLAQTDARSVRKLAALLNIQYRSLPNGAFNHSSVITLLTPTGEIAAQTSQIGKAEESFVHAIANQRPSRAIVLSP